MRICMKWSEWFLNGTWGLERPHLESSHGCVWGVTETHCWCESVLRDTQIQRITQCQNLQLFNLSCPHMHNYSFSSFVPCHYVQSRSYIYKPFFYKRDCKHICACKRLSTIVRLCLHLHIIRYRAECGVQSERMELFSGFWPEHRVLPPYAWLG